MSVPHFLTPLIGRNEPRHDLLAGDGGSVVADTLEIAGDSASRTRGLLGRDGLPEGTALVLAPCWAVHTFGMRFPIDIIYAARDGRIVKLSRNVRPWRMSAAPRAFATIEMATGAIDRARLARGVRLVVRPKTEP